VVLADASMDNAYLVADRLRKAFAAAAAVVDGETIHATASIGVSVIIDPCQDLAKLIMLADQALYLAKARGRNRVEVAPIEVADEPSELPAIVRARQRGLIFTSPDGTRARSSRALPAYPG
jgi:predicted signal transduction protein with EAL and GGDEF domain